MENLNSLEYRMKSGRVFTIDTPLLETEERFAVRVWEHGTIINDPRAQTYATDDEAHQAGVEFIKKVK